MEGLKAIKDMRPIPGELINIYYEEDQPTVSARELYEKLEISSQYTKWFERMVGYGFTENIDFKAVSQKRLTVQGNQTTYTDHQISLDMAKQICMLQRTEKGKLYRQYFIDLEKAWNTPEQVIARGLQAAVKLNNELKEKLSAKEKVIVLKDKQIAVMQPKADTFNEIIGDDKSLGIRQTARRLGITQSEFTNYLHDRGYMEKIDGIWVPTAKYEGSDLFEIRYYMNCYNHRPINQTYITPLGRERFFTELTPLRLAGKLVKGTETTKAAGLKRRKYQ